MKKELAEYFTSHTLEENKEHVKKIIDEIDEEGKISYIDLFNLTVAPIQLLTFPQHKGSMENMRRLDEFIALSIYFYIYCDFDYVLIVQGLEGIGKSTFSLKIIEKLKRLGLNFDMTKDMITKNWEYEDVIKKLETCKNTVIYFDEGKKFFDLRRSMYPERIDMLEYFTTERWRKNVYIIAASDLNEIDKYFRERRAKAICLNMDRGLVAFLHSKNLFGVGTDRFYLDKFEKDIDALKKIDFERQCAMLMELPSCFGVGFYEKMKGGIWNEYMNFKTAHFRKNPKDPIDSKLLKYLQNENLSK